MKRILVVTSYNPSHPTSSSKYLTNAFFEALALLGHEVHLFCYGPPSHPDKRHLSALGIASTTFFEVEDGYCHRGLMDVYKYSKDAYKAVYQLFHFSAKPDLVIVDGFSSADAVIQLYFSQAPIIYLAQQVASVLTESDEVISIEREIASTADRIMVLSERDIAPFLLLGAKDVSVFTPSLRSKRITPSFNGSIFYTGDGPNTDVSRDIAELLKLSEAGYRVTAVARRFWCAPKGLTVINYAPDLSQVMAQCRFAYFPSPSRTGLNPWLILALSAGLPVVCTSGAVEAPVATDLDAVLKMPIGELQKLAQTGVQYATDRYSVDKSVASLKSCLYGLI